MPDQYQKVTVPGVGDVNFPTSMSDDDIGAAIKKNYPQLGQGSSTFNGELPKGVGTPQDFVAKSPLANLPAPEKPSLIPPLTPFGQIKEGLGNAINAAGNQFPVVKKAQDWYENNVSKPDLLGPALNDAGGMIRRLHGAGPMGSVMMFDPFQKRDPNNALDTLGTKTIPDALTRKTHAPGTQEPDEPWYTGAPKVVGKGIYNTVRGLTTPESLAALAGFEVAPQSTLAKVGQTFFTEEALRGAGQGIVDTTKKLLNKDPYGALESGTGASINALFGGLGAASLGHGGTPETPRPETPVEPAKIQTPVPQPSVETAEKPAFKDLGSQYDTVVKDETGQQVGRVFATKLRDGSFRTTSGLKEEAQNKGLGTKAYQNTVAGLLKDNQTVVSDWDRSPQAEAVWNKLKTQYNVETVAPTPEMKREGATKDDVVYKIQPETHQATNPSLTPSTPTTVKHHIADTANTEFSPSYYSYKKAIKDITALSKVHVPPHHMLGKDLLTPDNFDKGLSETVQNHFEELPEDTKRTILNLPHVLDQETGEYLSPQEDIDNFRTSHVLGMRDAISNWEEDAFEESLPSRTGTDKVVTSRKPTHQALNPSQENAPEPIETPSTPTSGEAPARSIDAQEDTLRKLSGSVIRIKQLQKAASNRLDVEKAIRAVRGSEMFNSDGENTTNAQRAADEAATALLGNPQNQNALVPDTRVAPEGLEPEQKKIVQTVSSLLGKTPQDLFENKYRISDDDLTRLKQMRSSGKKPFDLKTAAPNHPEVPFGDQIPHPLAEINQANAKAAGIGNTKDLWSQASPEDKATWDRMKETSNAGGFEQEIAGNDDSKATRAGFEIVNRRRAEARGDVQTGGSDIDRLQFRHDAMQRILAKRLKMTRSKLNELIPSWQQARLEEKSASPLASQVDALGSASKSWLPKELYASEHLATKTVPSSPSPLVPESVPSSKAAPVGKTTEATDATSKQQGANTSIVDKISSLANDIQTNHGEEAYGAMPRIFDEVSKKYSQPDNANKAIYTVMRRYKGNLLNKIDNPLDKALSDTLDTAPPESSTQSTVYANPLVPMWNKMFGARQTAVLPQAISAIRLPESPISKFTDALNQRVTPSTRESAGAFINNEIGKIKDLIAGIPKFTSDALSKISDLTKASWEAYKTRPGLNPLELNLGYRRLQLSSNALVMKAFHDRIMKLHPDVERREAMINYLQASGGIMSDRDVNAQLQLKANSFAGSSALNRKLKRGYELAQTLSPEEKQTVQEYREYDKHLQVEEANQGLQLHARENYIRQIWSKDSFTRKAMDGVFSSSSFATTPNFAKLRTFEDYFEGEQAGYNPHRKDFAYLVSSRARASAEVLANRELIHSLYSDTNDLGEKLAQVQGIGNSTTINDPAYPTVTDADKKGALFIKQARPAEAITKDDRPYVSINHASFQNWKWVGQVKDETTGNTVEALYKGNMLVHPDIAPQLKRILEPSAVRSNVVGSLALKASALGKHTLLIGLFHPVQLGVHFLEHAAEGSTSARTMKTLNPLAKSILDLDHDENQQQLVIHGLKVADFNAESMWDEGVMSNGLAAGAPFVGKFWRSLHDATFSQYIPNLKMGMALDAFDRNMARYHDGYKAEEIAKGSNQAAASLQARSRIYRTTSEQMNAAFGGLNWDSLPVNKTWQDVARLTVLAPDFLLARMQFVGDAFRPGGWESRKALAVGALVQYTAARAFNAAMNDGDAKWDIHDWNKFIAGHHEYSLRTVQGDMVDSVLDPRRFWSYRVNPITVRPAIEFLSQKDVFSHPVSPMQEFVDYAKNIVPMPLQGLVDSITNRISPDKMRSGKEDDQIVDTIVQSMVGVHRKQYRTPAERQVFSDFDNIKGQPSNDELAMEQKNTFRDLREKYREGKLTPQMIQKAINDPKANLKISEARYLYRTKNESELVTRARQLEFGQVLSAWDKGSTAEKVELTPILRHKLLSLAPQERLAYQQKFNDFQRSLSTADQKKVRASIQKEIDWENPPVIHPKQ